MLFHACSWSGACKQAMHILPTLLTHACPKQLLYRGSAASTAPHMHSSFQCSPQVGLDLTDFRTLMPMWLSP
jgi:hypothetical protein